VGERPPRDPAPPALLGELQKLTLKDGGLATDMGNATHTLRNGGAHMTRMSHRRAPIVAALLAATLLVPATSLAATPPAPAPAPAPAAPTDAAAPAPTAAATPAAKGTPAPATAAKPATTPAKAAPTGAKAPAAATPPAGGVKHAPPTGSEPIAEDTSSGLLSLRNILLGGLLLLVGVGFALSKRAGGTSRRDPAADEQDAATKAAIAAADSEAEQAGVKSKKASRLGRRGRKGKQDAEATEVEVGALQPAAMLPQGDPVSLAPPTPELHADPAANVVALPGHEQWAQPQAEGAAAPMVAPPVPQPMQEQQPSTPAPQQSAPPAPVVEAAPLVAPAPPTPLTLEGTVVPGESPGEWITVDNGGNVVFQLTFSDGPALEVLFADAEGTWFQVPPMDPASGAVALPLDAGRYYIQLRDPAQRGASYRLVIWPPAATTQAAPTAPAEGSVAQFGEGGPQQLAA
jgi:hypothetical protein